MGTRKSGVGKTAASGVRKTANAVKKTAAKKSASKTAVAKKTSTNAAKKAVGKRSTAGTKERTAAQKGSAAKKSSSGSTPKAKKIVKGKMGEVMHEFKRHQLKSGPGGKAGTVRNPKQAIAIGLSEARKAGADIPAAPKKAVGKSAKRGSGNRR